MKIVALLLYQKEDHQLLSEAYNLEAKSFYQSWSLYNFKQIVRKLGHDLLSTANVREHTIIRSDTFQDYVVHLLLADTGLGIVVIMENPKVQSLPVHLIFQKCLARNAEDLKKNTYLKHLITEINQQLALYQVDQDAVRKIHEDLEDIRKIMHQNIEKVIERGESVEEILEKTQNLSITADAFRKRTHKLTGCCNIL